MTNPLVRRLAEALRRDGLLAHDLGYDAAQSLAEEALTAALEREPVFGTLLKGKYTATLLDGDRTQEDWGDMDRKMLHRLISIDREEP